MAKIEIPFSEVKLGERFVSIQTKRAFVGVKMLGVNYLANGDVLASCNAVMTFYDHQTEFGPQSGTLISVENNTIVEVSRNVVSKSIKIRRTLSWYEDNAVAEEVLEDGSMRFHFQDESSDTISGEDYQKMKEDSNYSPR